MDNKVRHNLHHCPGYLREEITLASDVSKSAIISHTFPSQCEVCSICGQLVQYKNTEPPIVDGEMQEPPASPQSDVRKMITPSLMDKFSPRSPDLTPQDSTMDTPLFDLDDIQTLTGPPLFPIPGSEDVQGRVVKAKSPSELYPSSLNLIPSSQLSDMSDLGSILIPPSSTRSNHSGHRSMTTLLHKSRPEDARRRRTPLACVNCRSRKVKVSKPFSKVSYPYSQYLSVVHSIQLKGALVSDVTMQEFSVNIVSKNY